ncbi:MAG: hypothetical protein LBB66_06325, partial [Desulfovibrio sp.]|nr:hypothetical protein [Desulfovibrio sp.]
MNIIKRLSSRSFLVFIAFALLITCAFKFAWFFDITGRDNVQNAWVGNIPKYVFLFIGDGMGEEQVKATEAYLAALQRNPSLAKDVIPFPDQKCFHFLSGNGKRDRMSRRYAEHFGRQGETALSPCRQIETAWMQFRFEIRIRRRIAL